MRTLARARRQDGSALLLVVLFGAIGLLLLCSVLNHSQNEALLSNRRGQFQLAGAAAQASTESVVAQMIRDFLQGGPAGVDGNLGSYVTLLPQQLKSKYTFGFAGGGSPATVLKVSDWRFASLGLTLPGLQATTATYRVTSQAREANKSDGLGAAVSQEIQFASIPLFQFGLFSAMDLEVTPSVAWSVTGRVHGNGNIYLEPNRVTLTFAHPVSAAGSILKESNPLDPTVRSPGTVTFQAESLSGVKSMNLYLGTNTGPNLLHEILDVPPVGESITSPMGRERYYNKAELIILISPATQVAKSGAYNNFATTVPWASVQKTVGAGGKTTGFVDLSPQFLDKREGTVMQVTEVDVQGFTNTSAYLTSVLGRPVRTLYVADLRTGSVNLPAVRLVNGQNLPAAGLTVATPNPLYVRGHYNAPSSALGTTNTTLTAPASLVCDALTVLSTGWSDDHSYYPLAYRRAANTTINAAVITGITPTGGGYYSGGAENILRMLENWRGRTLTFNGSLVVLYASETALSPWGAGWDVYDSGTRKYNFDQNFLNAAKLPSGTPNLRAAFRSVGTPIAAGAK